MFFIIKILLNFLIIGLFFHSKAALHKEKLDTQYRGYFQFFDNIFSPIFRFLEPMLKPIQIGQGVGLDVKPFVLLAILLLLMRL
jgi:YGGT family